ncbi:MAG TPA: lytic murein transglycosylase [Solirubrobacterales bacterium]|nr:lytic murein transglycosylase [Solirubrobacterales bacterium]
MGRIRNTLAAAAIGAALTAANASADEAPAPAPPAPTATESPPPASATIAPAPVAPPVEEGSTLAAPPAEPAPPKQTGGTPAAKPGGQKAGAAVSSPPAATVTPAAPSAPPFAIPSIPSSTCALSGVPPVLVPIYQRAAAAYGLGPQGAAVLAGINAVETAFGTNLNVSSAGAIGWMQFMPSTWETYGVDANGDGVRDPYNPEDAIFAAAGYLQAAGMPTDTYGAIYAYNHADWYVAEVLSNAACYAKDLGVTASSPGLLEPQLQVLECEPSPPWRKQIPAGYLSAFENAAARYELGRRGVWALAAVARLESNFGHGMTSEELRHAGPLGLEPSEWRRYAVDGDEDGLIRHADPADSAATLARLIWSRKGLSAGLFAHNHAQWYVQEVLEEAAQMKGGCKVSYVDWKIAPLPAGFETAGASAVLDGSLASAPSEAPTAVKAAIAAANSISATPYVWGGGHGSWVSPGYDCSGAVSFALYGAGLLDRPLTSGELESYGDPGPGRWITIYASPTHAYAEIAGLRWDTVGDAQGTGPRWHPEPPYPEGFVIRHPTGY